MQKYLTDIIFFSISIILILNHFGFADIDSIPYINDYIYTGGDEKIVILFIYLLYIIYVLHFTFEYKKYFNLYLLYKSIVLCFLLISVYLTLGELTNDILIGRYLVFTTFLSFILTYITLNIYFRGIILLRILLDKYNLIFNHYNYCFGLQFYKKSLFKNYFLVMLYILLFIFAIGIIPYYIFPYSVLFIFFSIIIFYCLIFILYLLITKKNSFFDKANIHFRSHYHLGVIREGQSMYSADNKYVKEIGKKFKLRFNLKKSFREIEDIYYSYLNEYFNRSNRLKSKGGFDEYFNNILLTDIVIPTTLTLKRGINGRFTFKGERESNIKLIYHSGKDELLTLKQFNKLIKNVRIHLLLWNTLNGKNEKISFLKDLIINSINGYKNNNKYSQEGDFELEDYKKFLSDKTMQVPLFCKYASIGDIGKMKEFLNSNSGYDIDTFDKNASGYNPLLIATAEGQLESVKFLLANGANPNLNAMNLGQSPLHFAAWYGFDEILKLLIDFGADINNLDNYGRSPLFLSIEKGYNKISKYLIKKGANLNIKNTHKKSVSDLCKEYKNGELLKLIRHKLGK